MSAQHTGDWWPEKLLARRPISQVIVCGRKLDPPPFSHMVNFPRLEIPLRGCYENQIEQEGQAKVVRLRPGSALLAAPNCWNFPTWQQKGEVMAILFGKKQLGISIVTASGDEGPQLQASKFSIAQPLHGPLPHLLKAINELHEHGPHQALAPMVSALLHCVQRLVQEVPKTEPESRAQGLFERVCVYLQSTYHEDVTRDSVAEQFQVTPNHLSRLFHTHGHMTFISYLTHVRIDRAKYLLCNYNLKLEDIAARCGFRDGPYFCRVFKRLTKTTPAEYRARMLQELSRKQAPEPAAPVGL